MKKLIIIKEIPDNLGGGWTAYREGTEFLCGDGDTPDMALEDFQILEDRLSSEPNNAGGQGTACQCYEGGDTPALLTDWRKTNICQSCGLPCR